jgi:hypothetical protein
MTDLAIEATGLAKSFGDTKALAGVDLAVRPTWAATSVASRVERGDLLVQRVTQAGAGDAKTVTGVVPYLEGTEERYPHLAIVAGLTRPPSRQGAIS